MNADNSFAEEEEGGDGKSVNAERNKNSSTASIILFLRECTKE